MTLLERFTRIVTMLRAAIGTHLVRQLHPPQPVWLGTRVFLPAAAPLKRPPLAQQVWTLLWLRLARQLARFEALHQGWRTNTLAPPRTPPKSRRRRQATPPLRLPRGFAWAIGRIPEAAPAAGALIDLLHNAPDTRRFVAEVPRAARLLRPLCQALGQRPPDWLKLPPRPRAPRPPKPRPERPWRLTDPRLGLQPYVIAAARHARKTDAA